MFLVSIVIIRFLLVCLARSRRKPRRVRYRIRYPGLTSPDREDSHDVFVIGSDIPVAASSQSTRTRTTRNRLEENSALRMSGNAETTVKITMRSENGTKKNRAEHGDRQVNTSSKKRLTRRVAKRIASVNEYQRVCLARSRRQPRRVRYRIRYPGRRF
ncbi:hypothetical protein PUN28_020179 [Cardiocondyla obscurior]|uniref:Secreted protein n=1 Tax=Cardiocondyla obscurior TaxID=286306 RepID=A0AAW2E717_9HYME